MRRKKKFQLGRQGQGVLEYVLLIAVVVAALSAMFVYLQRAVNSNLKIVEDQLNAQPIEASGSQPLDAGS